MVLFYYIFRGFTWIISWLPMPVLVVLSDILRFKIQYIFRYRKSVIMANLERSFPEKGKHEIRKISGRFYRNLADIVVETIKLERIRKDVLNDRCRIEGLETLQQSFDR